MRENPVKALSDAILARGLEILFVGSLFVGNLAIAKEPDFEIASQRTFVLPGREADVAAAEMGVIIGCNVRLGQRVRMGDVLARLDDEVLRCSYEVAIANRDAMGEQRHAEIEAQVEQLRLKAIEQLVETGDANPRELLQRKQEYEQARAKLAAQLERQQVREAECRRIAAQLRQRQIKAPFDGIIVSIHRLVGEFVSPTDATVFRLIDTSTLRAEFLLPLEEAEGLREGMPVRLDVMSLPPKDSLSAAPLRKPLTAKVEAVLPLIEPGTNKRKVIVHWENSGQQTLPGATCEWVGKASVQQAERLKSGQQRRR